MRSDTGGTDHDRVLTDIGQGRLQPVYLLYGEEEFLLESTLTAMIDAIIPAADRELGLVSLAGGPDEAERICAELVAPSLFGGRKLVVVRGSHLFLSRQTLAPLVRTVREKLDKHPSQAIAAFLSFIELAGWKLEDLDGDGWKAIRDEEWDRLVEGEGKDDRPIWLPRVLDLCRNGGIARSGSRRDETRLEDLLARRMPPENFLILVSETVDRRKKLFKIVSESGKVLHFTKVKGDRNQKERLMAQVRRMLDEKGKRLTPDAWEALGRKTGYDLRESVQAVEKLVMFSGDKGTIEGADVDAVVGKSREGSVFELMTAMTERDLSASLAVFHDLLFQGEAPLMVLAMIGREIRHLLQARLIFDAGLLKGFRNDMDYGAFQRNVYPVLKEMASRGGRKDMGLVSRHPYVAFQALKNARRFRQDELLGHLEDLVRIDLLLKSTSRDERLLVERFLIAFCTTDMPQGA